MAVYILERIEINPEIMLGKPVIHGTRTSRSRSFCENWLRGLTEADLLDAYPRLTRQDIQAALAYAAINRKSAKK